MRRFEVPGFHQISSPKNLLRLANSKADKIIDVVKHSRRNKNQAIEPIEIPPCPGMSFDVSLRPRSRLIEESIRSPNCPTMLTMMPSPSKRTGVSRPCRTNKMCAKRKEWRS